jgi:hypothetical protein
MNNKATATAAMTATLTLIAGVAFASEGPGVRNGMAEIYDAMDVEATDLGTIKELGVTTSFKEAGGLKCFEKSENKAPYRTSYDCKIDELYADDKVIYSSLNVEEKYPDRVTNMMTSTKIKEAGNLTCYRTVVIQTGEEDYVCGMK